MARQVILEKKAKEKILEQMEYLDEINSDTVADLIIPHMSFDTKKAIRQQAKRQANQLISKMKGKDGSRSWFACKDRYVNVEKTQNMEDLNIIEDSLAKKYVGLNKSKEKIERQKEILSGQLRIDAV